MTFTNSTDDPSAEQLEAYFTLEPRDLELIATCRYPHTKLSLALQLGTLKFLGTFSTEFAGVPRSVLEYLAAQLGAPDVNLERYAGSLKTRLEHQTLILAHLDYRRFEGAAVLRVIQRLFTKLLISNETTELLFDLVTQDLVDHRVILLGATTISHLIACVRERANVRLYTDLAQRLSKRQAGKLDALLVRERGETRTGLERLRSAPIDATTITLAAALKRLESIREVGVGNIKLDDVAENRLAPMVRFALTVRVADLEKHSRRRATLLALLQHLARSATDDVLTIFARVMDELDVRGRKRRQVECLRSLKDLDAAALTLRDVARVILNSSIPAAWVRATILERLGEPKLFEAITQVTNLASPAGSEEAEVWENAHRSVALFIVPLLTALRFEGGPGAKNLLEAMAFAQRTSGTARSSWVAAATRVIPQLASHCTVVEEHVFRAMTLKNAGCGAALNWLLGHGRFLLVVWFKNCKSF